MERFPVNGDSLRLVMDSMVSMYSELVEVTYKRIDVAQRKRDSRRANRRAKHTAKLQEEFHDADDMPQK
jgi:hypothetical protein